MCVWTSRRSTPRGGGRRMSVLRPLIGAQQRWNSELPNCSPASATRRMPSDTVAAQASTAVSRTRMTRAPKPVPDRSPFSSLRARVPARTSDRIPAFPSTQAVDTSRLDTCFGSVLGNCSPAAHAGQRRAVRAVPLSSVTPLLPKQDSANSGVRPGPAVLGSDPGSVQVGRDRSKGLAGCPLLRDAF